MRVNPPSWGAQGKELGVLGCSVTELDLQQCRRKFKKPLLKKIADRQKGDGKNQKFKKKKKKKKKIER